MLSKLEATTKVFEKVKQENPDFFTADNFSLNSFYQDLLDEYLTNFGFLINEKTGNYVFSNILQKNDISLLSSDLFEIQNRKKLFFKPVTLLKLKKSPKEIISKLAKEDNFIRESIDKKLVDIQQKLKNFSMTRHRQEQEKNSQKNKEQKGLLINRQYIEPDKVNFDAICLVHTTSYMPKRDAEKHLYIENTSYATDGLVPRATIHFSLNHIVESHIEGNWETTPYVILVPFNSMVKENGNPLEFSTVDTYFLGSPDKPMRLPDDCALVRSSEKIKKLYSLSPRMAFYKDKNFTDQEKTILLNFVANERRTKTTDKDDKFYANLSRKLATQKMMDYMGYSYIQSRSGSIAGDEELFEIFYKSATGKGLKAVPHKYGHAYNATAKPLQKASEDVYYINILTKAEALDKANKEKTKEWAKKHILDKEPLKELSSGTKEDEINAPVIRKYKTATNKILEELRKKYPSEEALFKYIDSLTR